MNALSTVIQPLDSSQSLPLYQQLQRILREAIEQEVLVDHDALPSERDIATEFGVSRITVRKAIKGLAAEGLIERRQGAGTFVTPRIQKKFSKLSSFSEDMASRGWHPHSEWLERTAGTATPKEASALGAAPGSAVYRFHRIRFANDIPLALEFSTIPVHGLPSLDAVGDSLYEALAAHAHRPVRAVQRLRAIAFTPEQAILLGVQAQDPGLLIERRSYLKNEQVVELTRSFYRGDVYDFITELVV